VPIYLLYSQFGWTFFPMSSQRMALGEKSFVLITWWVYASLSMCVYLNWSCGICWAKTKSDNFCRNYFLVSWEAIS
jgi:hypothetical protein